MARYKSRGANVSEVQVTSARSAPTVEMAHSKTALASEQTALQVLRRHWGHTSFRTGQWEAVSAILAGRDVVAVLPTGAGKSVCYQLPAILREGLVVVLSPLIALMVDQVEGLARRGIRATYVSSTLGRQQQRRRWRKVAAGEYKLLYLAPEQLKSSSFAAVLESTALAFVVVDEAHCISEWGDSFRPAFRTIVGHLPSGTQVVAVTATATSRVRKDVKQTLKMENPVQVVTGFDRPNIGFTVCVDVNRREHLAAILARNAGASVAYCLTRRSTVMWAKWLRERGIPTSAYHGGMDREMRDHEQAAWIAGSTRVMVSTSAFGMGIDKPDVRSVVHLGLPASIAAYYQQAGRAGRDGKPAEAVLLYRAADMLVQRAIVERAYRLASASRSFPVRRAALSARRSAHRQLAGMERYALTSVCRRHALLTHFGERHRPHCGACDTCRARSRSSRSGFDYAAAARQVYGSIAEGGLAWRSVALLDPRERRMIAEWIENARVRPPDDLDTNVSLASPTEGTNVRMQARQ